MKAHSVRPRIRVIDADGTIVIGPGKADLLEAIIGHGSIREAATGLGMSYMRAWTLVRTMNAAFDAPLVEKTRGGSSGGGAVVTPLGHRVLDAYREMEKRALAAIEPVWRTIEDE